MHIYVYIFIFGILKGTKSNGILLATPNLALLQLRPRFLNTSLHHRDLGLLRSVVEQMGWGRSR